MADVKTGSPYELERSKPMPSKNHSIVQSNLVFLLQQSYRERYRIVSEVTLVVNGLEKVPDVALFYPFPFEPEQDVSKVSDLPIGVIEILSPQQQIDSLLEKASYYFQAGIAAYWLVIPSLRTVYTFQSIHQYQAFVGEDMLSDPVLGIELSLHEVFR